MRKPLHEGTVFLDIETSHIEDVVEVYANGKVIPMDPPERRIAIDPLAWDRQFREARGAKLPIVATRWKHNGQTYENSNCPVPIPDMSGLVYATTGWKQWVVLQPDGSIKSVIDVPRVNEQSVPELGYLGDPSHDKDAPLHIMYGEGSDGDKDAYRFTFDMRTCTLLRAHFVGRHW